MVKKLLVFSCAIFLLTSCEKYYEKKAEGILSDFLQAAYTGNDSVIAVTYPDFSNLTPYAEKVNPTSLKLDSIRVQHLDKKIWELDKEFWENKLSLQLDNAARIYNFYYTSKEKKHVEFRVLTSSQLNIIVYSNFFKPINNGNIITSEVDGVFLKLHLCSEFVASEFLDILRGFENVSFVTYKTFDYTSEMSDSLFRIYPKAKKFNGNYIDYSNYKLKGMNLYYKSKNAYHPYYETEMIFDADSINHRKFKLKYYISDDIRKEGDRQKLLKHGWIYDSQHVYYYWDRAKKLEQQGATFYENLDNLTDAQLVKLFVNKADYVKKLQAKKAKRAIYEQLGLVIMNAEIARGKDDQGVPTKGISFRVFNPTNETIKYVIAEIAGVNVVGDQTTFVNKCRGIGPLDPHTFGEWTFSDVFPDKNDIIDDIKVGFTVVYMSGRTKNVSLRAGKADSEFSSSLWDQ